MTIVRTALLAAAASMFAAAAFAQTDPSASQQPMPPAASSQSMPADPITTPNTDMSQPATPDAMAPIGAAADTSATVDANGVVWHSAAPIPDTPANRAADGQPLSRTGKLTPPVGN